MTWAPTYQHRTLRPKFDKTGANCRGLDPEMFFPTTGDDGSRDVATAKQVCDTCPIREACGEYAIEANEQYGVWGGLTVKERERIRAHRQQERRRAS